MVTYLQYLLKVMISVFVRSLTVLKKYEWYLWAARIYVQTSFQVTIDPGAVGNSKPGAKCDSQEGIFPWRTIFLSSRVAVKILIWWSELCHLFQRQFKSHLLCSESELCDIKYCCSPINYQAINLFRMWKGQGPKGQFLIPILTPC